MCNFTCFRRGLNLPTDVLSLFVRDSSGKLPGAFLDDHQRQCLSCKAVLLPEKLDYNKPDDTNEKVKIELK